jgi:hypothetical protein
MQTIHTLRALTLSLATLAAGAAMAAEPVLMAKANVTHAPAVLRAATPTPTVVHAYPSLAEAEMIGMGYADFDAVLAEALNTPTAAGPMTTRAKIEALAASRMGGLMP